MDDYFGSSVAVADGTVMVGAHQEDSNATGLNGDQADNSANNSGAAYIFTRTGEIWSQQAYLKASNTDEGDYFGSAVTIAGDLVAVGAYGEASNATGVNGDQGNNSAFISGAVYLNRPRYPLTIMPDGTGTGSVVSIPAGIDCGVTCTVQIAIGSIVTLTATADPNSSFTGWSGGLITTTTPSLSQWTATKPLLPPSPSTNTS
ncbi:MAG: hypothetical protein IPL28_17275 [Chloroflexi bacterium]|nr:hypothetical protein [Chloroflexota bacterium]